MITQKSNSIFRMAGLAIVISGSALFAQTSGKLRLQIDPPTTFTYKLDHQFTMQQSEVELLEGPHHFSFWAPQRRVVDTTLTIVGGADRSFALRLPFATEYLVYQRDLKAYKRSMRFQRLIPAVATGGALIYTTVKFGQMKKAHDQLNVDREVYDAASSPHKIAILKAETIPAHKAEFDKTRAGYQIAAGLTVIFAGATAYMYLRSAKQKKPVFIDAEKVRFDGLSWTPGAKGGGWTGGLTWNFTR